MCHLSNKRKQKVLTAVSICVLILLILGFEICLVVLIIGCFNISNSDSTKIERENLIKVIVGSIGVCCISAIVLGFCVWTFKEERKGSNSLTG